MQLQHLAVDMSIEQLYMIKFNVLKYSQQLELPRAIREHGIVDLRVPRRSGKTTIVTEVANKVLLYLPSVLFVGSSVRMMAHNKNLRAEYKWLPQTLTGIKLGNAPWKTHAELPSIRDALTLALPLQYFDLVIYDEVEPDPNKYPGLVHFAMRT